MDCKKMTVVLVVAVVAFLPAITFATDFTVGDSDGWKLGVNYTEWAMGKVFKVGDKLIFNYKNPNHDVVKADGPNFKACTVPEGAVPLATGQDEIILKAEGKKWYLCSKTGHCDGGMKLVINVVSVSNTEAPASPPSSHGNGKIATLQNQIILIMGIVAAMAIMI